MRRFIAALLILLLLSALCGGCGKPLEVPLADYEKEVLSGLTENRILSERLKPIRVLYSSITFSPS